MSRLDGATNCQQVGMGSILNWLDISNSSYVSFLVSSSMLLPFCFSAAVVSEKFLIGLLISVVK